MTAVPVEQYKFKNGDEVNVIQGGVVGIVEDLNPNENYLQDDEYHLMVRSPNGSSKMIINVSEIQLVRKAEDIPAKELPTLAELVEHASSALLSSWDDALSVDETDRNEPEGQLVIFGESTTGQRFRARVTISDIELAGF